jgi:Galactose oxidase, central domain
MEEGMNCGHIPISIRTGRHDYHSSHKELNAHRNMPFTREHHTATLLSNGKVLAAGGTTGDSASIALSAAELFDPVPGTFSRTADMTSPRMSFTATLLEDGEVLVTGGYDNSGKSVVPQNCISNCRFRNVILRA